MTEVPVAGASSSQGLDVSSYQRPLTDVDIAGYDFVIVKATEGTSWTDPNFAHNWAFLGAALAAGKIVFRGAYHFFHPSLNSAAQVTHFMSTVEAQGLKELDVLVADIEILSGADDTLILTSDHRSHLLERGRHGEARARHGVDDYPMGGVFSQQLAPLSATAVNSASKAFLDGVAGEASRHVGNSSCPVLDYSDLSVAAQLISCTGYPLWVAYYASSAPAAVPPWPGWHLWQWAGGGAVDGGDRNAYNGTKTSLQAWINTYKPVTPPGPSGVTYLTDAEMEPILAALPVLTEGMTDAHLGVMFVRRLQGILNDVYGAKIAVTGVYDSATVSAVKTLIQTRYGLVVDGIVGPKTWKPVITGAN